MARLSQNRGTHLNYIGMSIGVEMTEKSVIYTVLVLAQWDWKHLSDARRIFL